MSPQQKEQRPIKPTTLKDRSGCISGICMIVQDRMAANLRHRMLAIALDQQAQARYLGDALQSVSHSGSETH